MDGRQEGSIFDDDRELIRFVRRIAVRVARRYGLPVPIDVDDLVSIGFEGLVQAWDRFDPSRGIEFEAFATRRVSGAMLDAIRQLDWVPRSARRHAKTGTPLRVVVSLEDAHGSGVIGDSLPDAGDEPGSSLLGAELRGELGEALNELPERERLILTLHYFDGVPLREIAGALGVTGSRVSQLHTHALGEVRLRLAS